MATSYCVTVIVTDVTGYVVRNFNTLAGVVRAPERPEQGGAERAALLFGALPDALLQGEGPRRPQMHRRGSHLLHQGRGLSSMTSANIITCSINVSLLALSEDFTLLPINM